MRRSCLAVSVCGLVAIMAASVWVQQASQSGGLADRFKQLNKNGDGKISAAEFPGPQLTQMDKNGDGFVTMEEARAFYARRGAQPPAATGTAQRRPRDLLAQFGSITPAPHKEEIAEQRPGEPPLKRMPDSDATRDAAGRGQMFESMLVTGLTDVQASMNGVAIVDLNKDGRLHIVATYSPRRGTGGQRGGGEKLRVFINDGGFRFHSHAIALADSTVTPERFGRGQVPGLADFNNDGFLDLFVTRHAPMTGGRANHWLRLRFSGVTDAALIGARVEVLDPSTEKLVAMRVIAANHSYKSGGALDAHVGLGARQQVHVRVTLAGQAPVTFTGVSADQFLDLNLKTRQSTAVLPKGQP